jgi:hypothetical protein
MKALHSNIKYRKFTAALNTALNSALAEIPYSQYIFYYSILDYRGGAK